MNRENGVEHPVWEGAIVGFLYAIESGMIAQEKIIPGMGQVCTELIQQGFLTDYGELQSYLRNRESLIQLVAQPFREEEMPRPDIRCVDVLTGEPRGHWLMVSVGSEEAGFQLQVLGRSHGTNEAILANDTGMLVV